MAQKKAKSNFITTGVITLIMLMYLAKYKNEIQEIVEINDQWGFFIVVDLVNYVIQLITNRFVMKRLSHSNFKKVKTWESCLSLFCFGWGNFGLYLMLDKQLYAWIAEPQVKFRKKYRDDSTRR